MTNKKYIIELEEVLAKATDRQVVDNFVRLILTSNEQSDIALRWQILKMLSTGMTQREVASKLGISIAKVTRGARALREHAKKLKFFL